MFLNSFGTHKYYVSTSFFEYKKSMNSLQVTIRVFEDDFINVLNTNYKNDLDLDSDLNQKKSWKFLGIMSYGAKFASSLYGPFRDALDSKPGFGDKKTYQMDFSNFRESVSEIKADIDEGADIIMIKPGITNLDIINEAKNTFNIPIAVYQVSGEYSMIKAGVKMGYFNHNEVLIESLTVIKRAGANMIATYFAKEAVKLIT